MKAIIELERSMTDEAYCNQQFDTWGKEKNILFINPQLSGKHLYKMLLPSRIMRSENISTAITTISKFDPEGQLLGGKEVEFTDKIIDWAEYFVFPFTTQPLVSEIYARIRERNPEAKIVYSIDFNFYELSDKHPYKYIFNESSVLNDVEDNIFFADIALVSNKEFQKYLITKIRGLIKDKYKDIYTKLVVGCFPFMIDTKIMYENVDFDAQDLETVIHPDAVKAEIDKTAEVSKKIKEKDIKQNKKNIPVETKPKAVKKTAIKSVKPNGNSRKSNSTTDKSKSKSANKPSRKRHKKK